MALPNQIDQATPPGSQSPSLGDDRIREFKTAVNDILGIPNATNVSAAGFLFAAAGLSRVAFQDLAGSPATAGHFQRNGANLEFHDGTAARVVVLPTNTVTLTNKTLTSPVLTDPALGGSDLTGADEIAFNDAVADATATGRLRRNAGNLTWHDGTAARRLDKLEGGGATRTIFDQAAAPVGWTRDAVVNDRVIRIVTGARADGGSWTITGLTADAHTHTFSGTTADTGGVAVSAGGGADMPDKFHTHGFSGTTAPPNTTIVSHAPGWRPLHRDVILCSKD